MISIIMPSYNSAEFIEQAIVSVRSQTFPHFELLVCDDGSTDATIEIVERLMRQDDRIKLLQNNCRNISRNCNIGLEQAAYPWIARLDADDVMLPTRLEVQMKAAEQDPSVALWGSYARLVNRRGQALRLLQNGPTTLEEFEQARLSGRLIVIQGPTVMFRRDIALQVGGYDPFFNSAEDLELLPRMMAFGPVRTLPTVLTEYRVHGSSLTSGRAAHQSRLIRYIEARNRANLAGRTIGSPEEFMRMLDTAPRSARMLEWVDGQARQNYRNASIHHAEGRVAQAVLCLTMAITLNPVFSVPRMSRRIGRGIARRLRAALKLADAKIPEWGSKPPGRPEEFHLQPPTEPCVNLSIYTARPSHCPAILR
jgi:glycosyltransferase involved in cell wall biosynthesis